MVVFLLVAVIVVSSAIGFLVGWRYGHAYASEDWSERLAEWEGTGRHPGLPVNPNSGSSRVSQGYFVQGRRSMHK